MPSRYRFKAGSPQRFRKIYSGELIESFQSPSLDESFADATGPKPWPYRDCVHHKLLSRATGIHFLNGDSEYRHEYSDWGSADSGTEIISEIMSRINDIVDLGPMEFQRNNALEIIPAVLDLDGTIALFLKKTWQQMFTRKNWKSSYGAVTWGLLPFASDLKSLANTALDLFNGRIAQELNDVAWKEKSFPIRINHWYDRPGFNDSYNIIIDGTLKLEGNFQCSTPIDAAAGLRILADEIGFNPDFKTAWDVLPLSFVADYFLPVGDTIESIHPRGWFHPTIDFGGNCSIKAFWRISLPCDYGKRTPSGYMIGKTYSRFYSGLSFSRKSKSNIDWEAPNAKQLFNTAYLAAQSSGRRR